MKLTDHQLGVRILALEEEEAVDAWIEKWDPQFADWGKQEHSGDCTKQPWTCMRCVYENTMQRVPDYRRILGI